MASLKLMQVGYNLVERALIGKEFEEIKDKISIIEFLRRLERKETIKPKISVAGLEEALLCGGEVTQYVRKILSNSVGVLRTHIIQLPINGELTLNKKPRIIYKAKEISLTPIFGNRIKPISIGYFHSPPNI